MIEDQRAAVVVYLDDLVATPDEWAYLARVNAATLDRLIVDDPDVDGKRRP